MRRPRIKRKARTRTNLPSTKRTTISIDHQKMPAEIPGFFFDPVKNRYFKVESSSTASHAYNAATIKSKQQDEDQRRKRLKRGKEQLEKLPPIHDAHLTVRNRLQFQSRGEMLKKLRRYSLETMTLKDNIEHPTSTQLKKLGPFTGDSFVASDVVNIYQYRASGECKLLLNRIDKNTSVLRSFETSDTSPLTVRTWMGSLDEPSEIEITTYDDDGEIKESELIINPKESFNSSVYNAKADCLVACCSRGIIKYDLDVGTLLKSTTVKLQGDALSVDFRDRNVYCVGFRNGGLRVLDSRATFNGNMAFSACQTKSVINLKCQGDYSVICSSIGPELKLFDLRMGMNEPSRTFHYNKMVVNPFGENMDTVSNKEFLLQSKNLLEIFNIAEEEPVKVITDYDRKGEAISSAKWIDRAGPLLTLSPKGIQRYIFSTGS